MSFYDALYDFNFENWRNEARRLILAQAPPPAIAWRSLHDANLSLFPLPATAAAPTTRATSFHVPADFLARAKFVYAYRSDDNAAFLYRLLWRMIHEEPNLLKISIDDDVREFDLRYRAVKRDLHKMHAFVRFRQVEDRFIAWHRPDHLVVRLAAPFFVERFHGMNWSILTSDECLHWDQQKLTFSEGLPQSAAPREDDAEALWKTYYQSIFNPARIKWKAMLKEFPERHWKTLPEAALIRDLVRTAPERLQKFYRDQTPSAEAWIPKTESPLTLLDLQAALPRCEACGICARATQPVMGEGPADAEIFLIGEQPGEEEDRAGRPFIGPSGQLLNQALALNGIAREMIYVTNAVKAFKWTETETNFRLHRGSSPQEIAACQPWLKRELDIVKPKKIICLGRSAGRCPDFGGNSLERIQDGWNINSLTQLLGQATVV
jgi:probable DNA metabolism protein